MARHYGISEENLSAELQFVCATIGRIVSIDALLVLGQEVRLALNMGTSVSVTGPVFFESI